MKKLVSFAVALCFILVSTLTFAGDWTGVITETMCGAKHAAGTEKDAQCVKNCVKAGHGKLALLVGDTLYTITNPEKAVGHEGHKVKVTGKTDETAKTVTIDSISMAQ